VPALRVGEPAELVLFDTKGLLRFDPSRLLSMGKNTPLEGRDLRGRVLLTLAGGRIVHENWFAVSR
jgi:dihydroorotase